MCDTRNSQVYGTPQQRGQHVRLWDQHFIAEINQSSWAVIMSCCDVLATTRHLPEQTAETQETENEKRWVKIADRKKRRDDRWGEDKKKTSVDLRTGSYISKIEYRLQSWGRDAELQEMKNILTPLEDTGPRYSAGSLVWCMSPPHPPSHS